jgi:hypothetical protein
MRCRAFVVSVARNSGLFRIALEFGDEESVGAGRMRGKEQPR